MSDKIYTFPSGKPDSEFIKIINEFIYAASGQRIKDRIKELEMENTLKLWIARDKDGDLLITDAKPKLSIDKNGQPHGWWEGYDDYKLLHERLEMNESEEYKDLYPELTFENSPQQVELISSEEYNRLKEIKEDWLKHIGYGPDAYD